jgi:hypothetical protein
MIASALLVDNNMTNWIKIDRLKIDKENYQMSVLYLNQQKLPEMWVGTYNRNTHLFLNQTILKYIEDNENPAKKAYCLSAYQNYDRFQKKIKDDIEWAFSDAQIISFCQSYLS